jgi:hypothetical protein
MMFLFDAIGGTSGKRRVSLLFGMPNTRLVDPAILETVSPIDNGPACE